LISLPIIRSDGPVGSKTGVIGAAKPLLQSRPVLVLDRRNMLRRLVLILLMVTQGRYNARPTQGTAPTSVHPPFDRVQPLRQRVRLRRGWPAQSMRGCWPQIERLAIKTLGNEWPGNERLVLW